MKHLHKSQNRQGVRSSIRALIVFMVGAVMSSAEAQVLRPEVIARQDDINNGVYTLDELFYRGVHLFTNSYTPDDGLGEAEDGPRRMLLNLGENKVSPFLRINGLDAQSCRECHAHAGFKEVGGLSMPYEAGVLGGSAGVSANVMIFKKANNFSEGIVRNPPHLFGAGYTQRLAEEMTGDLQRMEAEMREEAFTTGETVRREMISKGINFGWLSINGVGAADRSELEGVSMDLVVRPFQFKGVASSLRMFIAGALNFHFSVQPREMMERHLLPDDNPTNKLANDKLHEIDEGEVTSIAVFLAALRPPVVRNEGFDPDRVERGRVLFSQVGCASCHVPTMKIENPYIHIMDPRFVRDLQRKLDTKSLWKAEEEEAFKMVPAVPSSDLLDVVVYTKEKSNRVPGYTFHLTHENFPDEALPRLPENQDGTIDVPLFSDLKRHRMGQQLADTVQQETDVRSIFVNEDEFVTRALWGVADTGPWLHDGRAATLMDAILLHEGEGSEANEVIEAFRMLTEDDRTTIIEFLQTLRLDPKGNPLEPGVKHRTGMMLR